VSRRDESCRAAAARHGHEPGARVVRDTCLGPLFERCDERVLRKVFGQPDIANDTGQAGDQPGGFDPPDRVDRLLGR
jgi:hypothetical protein